MKNDPRLRGSSRPQFFLLILLLFTLLAAGCSSTSSDSQDFVYIPPTPAVSRQAPLASPTAAPTTPPSPTPACTNNLLFVKDLTIPDGYPAQPGEQLDKRWQIQNAGTCNWDENYSLQLIAGESLGANEQQSLYPARSSTQATLRISFTAPADAGVFRSAWQAFDPQDEPFGDPIFIEIAVSGQNP